VVVVVLVVDGVVTVVVVDTAIVLVVVVGTGVFAAWKRSAQGEKRPPLSFAMKVPRGSPVNQS
jgi:hypothetical protein